MLLSMTTLLHTPTYQLAELKTSQSLSIANGFTVKPQSSLMWGLAVHVGPTMIVPPPEQRC